MSADDRWLMNHRDTGLYSSPNADAELFTRVPQWSMFLQRANQVGARILVRYFGNRTSQEGDAYVTALDVGPIGAPDQIPPVEPDFEDYIYTEFGRAPDDLADAIRKHFPPAQVVNAARIAFCESSWRQYALADTTDRGPCGTPYTLADGRGAVTEIARGYFQINGCAHPEWNDDSLYDTEKNVLAARQLFGERGWQPWLYSAQRLGLL